MFMLSRNRYSVRQRQSSEKGGRSNLISGSLTNLIDLTVLFGANLLGTKMAEQVGSVSRLNGLVVP